MVDIEKNFWDNKVLKNYFKEIYNEDKSLNKRFSSELMWCMYLAYHYEGEYVNLDDESKIAYLIQLFNSKHSSVKEDILERIKPHLDKFYKLIETPSRKSLREWNEKMTERAKFIKDTPYSPDYEDDIIDKNGNPKTIVIKGTHKMLDDMMKATESIWESYWVIMEKLNKEGKKAIGEAGAELSLSDKREI